MFKKLLFSCLALALTINSIHLQQSHQAVDLAPGPVNLKADNGKYLDACFECGKGLKSFSASISTHPQAWTLEVVGDKVAFKSSFGKYLSRCKWCWADNSAIYDDAVFVHAETSSSSDPWAQWTPELQSNGKYAFKSDNGNYLARCHGCVGDSNQQDFAFVHSSSAEESYAQWDLTYAVQPQLNTRYQIAADNGQFLQICSSCNLIRDNFRPVAVADPSTVVDRGWTFEQRPNGKFSLKSNGNYLSRCNGCWNDAIYPDSAFLETTQSDTPYTQWKAVKQATGKWTFQSDTGKYLARCFGCNSNLPNANFAFIHSENPHDTVAQWTLTSS